MSDTTSDRKEILEALDRLERVRKFSLKKVYGTGLLIQEVRAEHYADCRLLVYALLSELSSPTSLPGLHAKMRELDEERRRVQAAIAEAEILAKGEWRVLSYDEHDRHHEEFFTDEAEARARLAVLTGCGASLWRRDKLIQRG